MVINSQTANSANFTISGSTNLFANGTYIVDGGSGHGGVHNAHISLYDNDTSTRFVSAKSTNGSTLTLNIELPVSIIATAYKISMKPNDTTITLSLIHI